MRDVPVPTRSATSLWFDTIRRQPRYLVREQGQGHYGSRGQRHHSRPRGRPIQRWRIYAIGTGGAETCWPVTPRPGNSIRASTEPALRAIGLAGGGGRLVCGNILIAGSVGNADGSYDMAVARYTAAGALDRNFGTQGLATSGLLQYNDFGHAIAVDSNGGVYVVGSATTYTGETWTSRRALSSSASRPTARCTWLWNGWWDQRCEHDGTAERRRLAPRTRHVPLPSTPLDGLLSLPERLIPASANPMTGGSPRSASILTARPTRGSAPTGSSSPTWATPTTRIAPNRIRSSSRATR